MKNNVLFPKVDGLLHGGDYNPEQWLDRPDILKKDIQYMKEAHINSVTLGVFSWSTHEPTEGNINLDWLADIMDSLYAEGIYTVLATPSGARPAWLDEKYPSAMRCDNMGVRNHHGFRHNHCMQSLEYREKVKIIDTALAQRFSNHPGLLMWHISNELGGYCYCDTCRKKFQEWLSDRYDHDINKLNKAWWTTFWSHTFNSFDQIDPPYANGEDCVLGLNLDWKRFSTWSATDFMKFEIDTVKSVNPEVPVTTNFMDMFYDYDYHYMCQFVDYISWDNYPEMHNNWWSDSDTMLERSFNHAMFRSMKPDQPYMMMESAPGVVNWRPYNKYRRPGVHKLISMQAIANGSDTVQYFQIRKSRGSSEQFHGALIDHIGTNDTRIFKEVASLGADLEKLSELTGSLSSNQVAIIYDWDNRWAIDDAWALANETKNYDKTCLKVYSQFMSLGIDPDIISSDMDWSRYKVICAPMLYMLHDGVSDKIRDFVEKGGEFMATYFTGYVDKSTLTWLGGFPGDGLSEVFGLRSEEIDTLYAEDKVSINILDKAGRSPHSVEVHDYQELLRDVSADVLAKYACDYMEGTPAITRNTYGKGHAYYVACRTSQKDLEFLYREMLEHADIAYTNLPAGVEKHTRYLEDRRFDFYLNCSDKSVTIPAICGYEMLSEATIDGDLTLDKYGVAVIRS